MSNHKLDPKYFENREACKKAYNKQQHEKKDSPAETETSFAQTKADCYACGKKGHMARDCTRKPNKYADWHVCLLISCRCIAKGTADAIASSSSLLCHVHPFWMSEPDNCSIKRQLGSTNNEGFPALFQGLPPRNATKITITSMLRDSEWSP